MAGVPDADRGHDPVSVAGQTHQHGGSVIRSGRLAENLTFELDDRIGRQHESRHGAVVRVAYVAGTGLHLRETQNRFLRPSAGLLVFLDVAG